ncbi:MAG: hypothetical protein KC417_16480, partial [Myxococcales bacterium]|nr:hypothetical protein [Myxococcales bacterium]
PSVIVETVHGRDDLEDADALRFRLARAVEFARPEHILLSTRGEAEGRRLVEAVVAAFGPRASSEPMTDLPPDVTELAGELWRLLPPAAQTEATEILTELGGDLDYGAMSMGLRCRAACAGLAACGRIGPSVRGLSADDESLANITITTEAEYIRACVDSKPLRSLLRFALSDEYLAAHSLTATYTP